MQRGLLSQPRGRMCQCTASAAASCKKWRADHLTHRAAHDMHARWQAQTLLRNCTLWVAFDCVRSCGGDGNRCEQVSYGAGTAHNDGMRDIAETNCLFFNHCSLRMHVELQSSNAALASGITLCISNSSAASTSSLDVAGKTHHTLRCTACPSRALAARACVSCSKLSVTASVNVHKAVPNLKQPNRARPSSCWLGGAWQTSAM